MIDANDFLISKGYIYSDFAPRNIGLTEDYEIKMIDLDCILSLTLDTKKFEGSLMSYYVAPEIKKKASQGFYKISDLIKGNIYSIGAIVSYALYISSNEDDQNLCDDFLDISKLKIKTNNELTKLCGLVIKMISENLEERPNSEAIIQELAEI